MFSLLCICIMRFCYRRESTALLYHSVFMHINYLSFLCSSSFAFSLTHVSILFSYLQVQHICESMIFIDKVSTWLLTFLIWCSANIFSTSHQIILYHILWYHNITYHIILYHIMAYHIISYDIVSQQMESVSFSFLFLTSPLGHQFTF